MALIEVDVDLDDFDTDELISELEHHLESNYTKQKDKDLIIEFISDNSKISIPTIPQYTLEDTMKLELIAEKISRFSLTEIETFFNQK